ncbi:HAMP domain-containing protein [Candidatus Obscuribacterales bacterium]|nr:HAMP domain-containing protein [Candidatus Obscuribacterales bacterium]
MRSIQSIIFTRLFVIIIIFFGVVSAVAYYLTNEAIRQFVVADSTTSLAFIINNVKANYGADLEALDDLTRMPGFLPFEPKQAQSTLKEFLAFPNIYNTVHMYRADGELVFAERRSTMGPYTPKTNFRRKNKAFIELADRVLKEKKSHASEVFFSPNGTLYQTYVSPVFADREKTQIFGVLSGAVFPRLQKIEHLLHGLQLGQDNFILITDSSGHFLTSDGINEKDANSAIREHTDHATRHFYGPNSKIDGNAFVDYHEDLGPNQYIVISLPIDELKLVVTLGVNTHRIEAKNKELTYRLLVALVLGLVLSLVASIVVGDRLAKPFRQVADAVNQINNGNFSARVTYAGEDEIGYLSKTINALAEKIQKSEYLGNLWQTEKLEPDDLESLPESGADNATDKS